MTETKTKTCKTEGCTNQTLAKGLCQVCYDRARHAERPECSEDGCRAKARGKHGLCQKHRNESLGQLCTIGGCERPLYANGWCHQHNQRARKNNGDPGPADIRDYERHVQPLPQGATTAERLEAYSDRSGGPNSCWDWRGYCGWDGYPQIHDGEKMGFAHRVMYALHVEPLAHGMHVDHLCCNPACINPDHLEQVEPAENGRRAQEHKRTGLTTLERRQQGLESPRPEETTAA